MGLICSGQGPCGVTESAEVKVGWVLRRVGKPLVVWGAVGDEVVAGVRVEAGWEGRAGAGRSGGLGEGEVGEVVEGGGCGVAMGGLE